MGREDATRSVAPRRDLPRVLGFWGASAIMVGIIIGSGIFRTPPVIANQLGSPMLILVLWLAGGLLALFGALTYAELATMYPQSGGVYVFLREGFGRPMAFVFGWTYMLVTKPAAAAGIPLVFAEHMNSLLGVEWSPPITAAVLLVVLTGINILGVGLGAGIAKVLTGLKVLALIGIVLLAIALRKGSAANFHGAPPPQAFWVGLTAVMASIMWTYDGWSDVGAVAGEVRDPSRRLWRVYVAGTLAVIGIYLAVNAVYFWLVPIEEMRRTATIGPLVMERLVGPVGGTVVLVIVMISTLGSTHGSVITGARVTFAQANDGLMFGFLGRVHPRFKTPATALLVQVALSLAALGYSRTFARLADTFVFTMWIFYGLAGAAIFILRFRRPDAPRAYRCWGYPVVPAVFVASAAAMTALSIATDLSDTNSRGVNTLPWLAVLAAGWPVYYGWQWLVRRGRERRSASHADRGG